MNKEKIIKSKDRQERKNHMNPLEFFFTISRKQQTSDRKRKEKGENDEKAMKPTYNHQFFFWLLLESIKIEQSFLF